MGVAANGNGCDGLDGRRQRMTTWRNGGAED
jgi:hypothetical protein